MLIATRHDRLRDARTVLPVSVAIPVKNEAANLEHCLARLGRFAEVVVIDSSSTDRTKEIARAFGARVVNFEWNGKAPKKRNWFLLNAPPTQPWVLFLDADELINEDFCNAVEDAVLDDRFNGYWLNYRNYFLGRALRYGVAQRKLALFRVGSGLYERIDEDRWSGFDMEIHEHPIIDGLVGEIDVQIDHEDRRGLANWIAKHQEYALWEARRYREFTRDRSAYENFTKRQRFKYRNMVKWWYPWVYFLFTYVAKLGFIDGRAGLNYAFYKASYFQTIRLLVQEK